MIWHRLLVRSSSMIADPYHTLQIAFGWSDAQVNRFHIDGRDGRVLRGGGIRFLCAASTGMAPVVDAAILICAPVFR